MRIALTGHRPQRLGLPDDETSDKWEYIIDWLSQQIIKIVEVSLIEDETVDLYCGMASGCDIAFGLVGTILKEGLGCKLHCVLPCINYIIQLKNMLTNGLSYQMNSTKAVTM